MTDTPLGIHLRFKNPTIHRIVTEAGEVYWRMDSGAYKQLAPVDNSVRHSQIKRTQMYLNRYSARIVDDTTPGRWDDAPAGRRILEPLAYTGADVTIGVLTEGAGLWQLVFTPTGRRSWERFSDPADTIPFTAKGVADYYQRRWGIRILGSWLPEEPRPIEILADRFAPLVEAFARLGAAARDIAEAAAKAAEAMARPDDHAAGTK